MKRMIAILSLLSCLVEAQTNVDIDVGIIQPPEWKEQQITHYDYMYYAGTESNNPIPNVRGGSIWVNATSPDTVWTTVRVTKTDIFYFRAGAKSVNTYNIPSIYTYSTTIMIDPRNVPDPPVMILLTPRIIR